MNDKGRNRPEPEAKEASSAAMMIISVMKKMMAYRF